MVIDVQCFLIMWKALPVLLQYLDLNIGLSFRGSWALVARVEWNLIFFKCLLMRFKGNPLLCRLCLCFKMILWKSSCLELVRRNLIASPITTPLKMPGG